MTDKEKVLQALEHCDLCSDMPNCPGCAYLREPDCMEHLKQDITALLRHEVSAQEPRVLTLDEYRAIAEKPAEERVPVWLEWRGGSGRWTIPERAYAVYGESWRCWTGEPSKEQMEATPWE